MIDELVDSLLFEGYALYPYTPGAGKNATPTPFGIVYPAGYAHGFDHLQVQALVRGEDPHVEVDVRLTKLGLDSLVAVQFKNRVGRDLGLEISLVDTLRGASIATLTERLLTELRVDALRAAEPSIGAMQEQARGSLREEFAL